MENSNKKIALNTLYMYLRLFITLIIGLYTSRIVLLVLGISDYGLFNVVGGILSLFTFISGSLSAATSRFFNVEMGKKDGDVNKSYNINLILHLALATLTFILAETIGLWYVYNKLNVPNGQLEDALFIYHISIISSCIGIISGPCQSLFQAHERFKFMAKFDIINTIIRLLGVLLLQKYSGNSLRFYTIIMFLTSVNSIFIYYIVAYRSWPKILRLRFVRDWEQYKSVISFGGWNLFSTISLVARSTGCDLIINYFFNTAINGALAVSKTVNNYILTFSNNFDSASGPQIIQSYSSGDMSRCNYLVNKMGRFCILLFEFIFFPLYIELEFVLKLWLKEVPDNVLAFCQYNLILAGISLTCGGIVQVINASGKIKWFKISGSMFFLMCIPLGFIIYKYGAPAYSILILFLVADILQRAVQLILMKRIIGFNSLNYVKEAYFRPFLILTLMTIILLSYPKSYFQSEILKFLAITLCGIVNTTLIYFIGLTKGEQSKVYNIVRNKYYLLHKNN